MRRRSYGLPRCQHNDIHTGEKQRFLWIHDSLGNQFIAGSMLAGPTGGDEFHPQYCGFVDQNRMRNKTHTRSSKTYTASTPFKSGARDKKLCCLLEGYCNIGAIYWCQCFTFKTEPGWVCRWQARVFFCVRAFEGFAEWDGGIGSRTSNIRFGECIPNWSW